MSPLVGAPLGKTMFKLAVPGVIGALFFSGLGLVEVIFLRHAGADALAAVALVFPLIMLAAMFSAGAVGGAISGFTARALGAGNTDEASAILVCAVLISFVGGGLMWALVVIFGPLLYERASHSLVVSTAAVQYASLVFPAIPIFWLVNMLCSVLRGAGDMIRPALVAALMVLAYLILGPMLLPTGEVSLEETIRASGLAMVGAYIASLILTLLFIYQQQHVVQLRWSAFNMRILVGILKQGLLASSQSLMTIMYALVTTLLFSRFGTDWLAGFGLAVRLELIMVPVIFGVGATLIAIVGAYAGAGQRARAISIAWRGIFINAALVGAVGLVFFLFPSLWCDLVGSDETVIEHCSQSLKFIAPTYVFFALGLGGYFACQGLNTLKYPVLGSLLRLLIVTTGLYWVTATTAINTVLFLVGFAIISYGLLVVIGLKFDSWRVDNS